jgi:hypothetical protein
VRFWQAWVYRALFSIGALVIAGRISMCRSIKTLHNFEPPASDEEIRASALQFVRKLSGFTRPSRANDQAFARAVDEVAEAARKLLAALVTNAAPRDRQLEASKARAKAAGRLRSSESAARTMP